MKLRGARLIAVELVGAVAVAGAVAGVAASGDTASRPNPNASASWAAVFEVKQKRSIDAGRFAQALIEGRGYERSQALCAAEWAKLGPQRQAELDEIAFDAGCTFQR
ncbi:hypothetical protein ACFYUY_04380 [Kitasatospora sp. NPDC004745]|uniref:hypothetical protein n=1 Tax=Kitasatospora sp. NPDC004745 TaxID=3364019 RepID=UPI00369DE0A9